MQFQVSPETQKQSTSKFRTYSRKKALVAEVAASQVSTDNENGAQKEPSSPLNLSTTSNSSKVPTVIPPCYPTLVGFKGLTLAYKGMKIKAELDDLDAMDSKKRPKFTNVDKSSTLKAGLHHPEVLRVEAQNTVEGTSTPESRARNRDLKGHLTVEEADRLLFERFKALFLWPAMMASSK